MGHSFEKIRVVLFYILLIVNKLHNKTKTNYVLVCLSILSVFDWRRKYLEKAQIHSFIFFKETGENHSSSFIIDEGNSLFKQVISSNFLKQLDIFKSNFTQTGGRREFVGDYFQPWINKHLVF